MFSQIMFTFGQVLVEAINSFMHALLVTWTTTNKHYGMERAYFRCVYSQVHSWASASNKAVASLPFCLENFYCKGSTEKIKAFFPVAEFHRRDQSAIHIDNLKLELFLKHNGNILKLELEINSKKFIPLAEWLCSPLFHCH